MLFHRGQDSQLLIPLIRALIGWILSRGRGNLPALLQSTEKLLFCPMKALLRPGPRRSTLLASEKGWLGALLCQGLLEACSTGSTVRVEVSLALETWTRREPRRKDGPAEAG